MSDHAAVLVDWILDDEEGGSSPKVFTLSIPANGYEVIEFASSVFNNSGDQVRLFQDNGALVDEFSYTGSQAGISWGRSPNDFRRICLQSPTQAEPNSDCIESTPSITPTHTKTPSPTRTPSPTKSPSPTRTPTQTKTPSPTRLPTPQSPERISVGTSQADPLPPTTTYVLGAVTEHAKTAESPRVDLLEKEVADPSPIPAKPHSRKASELFLAIAGIQSAAIIMGYQMIALWKQLHV
jgi:hypothetical protein